MDKMKTFVEKRNRFNKVVVAYNKYRTDYPKEIYSFINKECPKKDARVLDLACGTGILTRHLAKMYNDVYGADKDSSMLSFAKKNLKGKGVTFKKAKAENLPFRKDFFDLLTVAQSFHWFSNNKAMREIKRVLKPDGKFIIISKLLAKKRAHPYFVIRIFDCYNKNALRKVTRISRIKILRKFGFKNVTKNIYRYKSRLSLKNYIGLMQSHSGFNLLDNRQKKELIADLKKELKKRFSKGHIIFDGVATVWSGTKK